jgi:hypothetical protein
MLNVAGISKTLIGSIEHFIIESIIQPLDSAVDILKPYPEGFYVGGLIIFVILILIKLEELIIDGHEIEN